MLNLLFLVTSLISKSLITDFEISVFNNPTPQKFFKTIFPQVSLSIQSHLHQYPDGAITAGHS